MSFDVDVGESRAHSHTVGVIHGTRATPVASGWLWSSTIWCPAATAAAWQGGLEGKPAIRMVAVDRNGAVEPVEVITDVRVGFQLAEVRQTPYVGPFIVALRRPAS